MMTRTFRFSIFFALVTGCATPALAPDPVEQDPFEIALGETTSELETHRANVLALASMTDLPAEIARHAEVRGPLYDELRERAAGGFCGDTSAQAAVVGLFNGMEATERGLEQALGKVTTHDGAARAFDGYGAGIAQLRGKVSARWSAKTCTE